MRVLLNDLPREEKEGAERFSSLEKIAEECEVAFLLCYGSMTVSFGETGLTFIKAIPFMIASLAPALVVCAISKELRMPSNRQEAKVELEELA